jgi:citrate lyase synthetase
LFVGSSCVFLFRCLLLFQIIANLEHKVSMLEADKATLTTQLAKAKEAANAGKKKGTRSGRKYMLGLGK